MLFDGKASSSKGGNMEIFLGLVGIWAYFSYRAKKERRKDDIIYNRLLEDALQEQESQQKEYDQLIESLPIIYGPSTYSVRVNTNSADKDVIPAYKEFLMRAHTLDTEFNSILEHQTNHPTQSHALRVEVGQATFGYLYLDNNKEICDELDLYGGRASCEGKLKVDQATGLTEVYLDIDFPLVLDPNGNQQE